MNTLNLCVFDLCHKRRFQGGVSHVKKQYFNLVLELEVFIGAC